MKIEEYLGTLPSNLLSGEDAELPQGALEDIFRFAGIGSGDVFYHLGCGSGRGVMTAMRLGAAKAVGVDNNPEKIRLAQEKLGESGAQMVCADVRDADISDATIILYWFADEEITDRMLGRFKTLPPGVRILTIWGPLPDCIPEKVRFPYIINKTPLQEARNMQEQLTAVFGVDCVDFVTAWEFAERYTKAVGSPGAGNDRFLTIIQTLIIWINARNLGMACGEEIPDPIRAYMSIMRETFGIDFGHLLEQT
ncbi:MAG: class I SAM-dependent methyltransferase [Nitrosopumilus sp. H8]|nr:MAG: class I SAM-dependent methyltransferase [Nitrosopumilus sp. H13]RNJ78664.1 MAG: class I SAM-dependent methyltransferase [Nitrosopumilus sp. H8]